MAIAIRGAEILREYEGVYTNRVIYKQRCDVCGYVAPRPPITVSIPPGETVAHGIHHVETFVCPFCQNLQAVEIQG